ncbi:hypothetical protein D9M68_883990 [compost metagenome]
MVMMMEMPTSTATWRAKLASATLPKVMTMISAERMKSVRTAPWIFSFSKATRSICSSLTACTSSAWCCWSSALRLASACTTFSVPS